MLKKDELATTGSCLNNARDDEMIFVLLARDPAAPIAIRKWAETRILLGLNKASDDKIRNALECALIMDEQAAHRKTSGS